MKELNWAGVIIATSVLIVPWLGISKELFHFVYGLIFLMYTLIYAGHVISSRSPVPGLRTVELNYGRGTVDGIMLTMVLIVMIYAAYGVRSWLMVVSGAG